jgi:hypothetical protein
MPRAVPALLLLALCLVEAGALARPAGPGVVVTADMSTSRPVPGPEEPALAADPTSPTFLAHMTADDVARGVYGLGAETGAVALSPAQRGAIAPLLRDGAALRTRLGELRMERRTAREAWEADGARIVAVLGPARAEQAARGGRAP